MDRIADAVKGGLRTIGLLEPLTGAFSRLTSPPLRKSLPAPLEDETLAPLLAAAEALTDMRVEMSHYAQFFQWRAEHLPGHHALYTRFARVVNAAARRSCKKDFAECPRDVRARMLRSAFLTRTASGRLRRLQIGLLQREWLLFDRHIVRESLGLFARTDAWRLAGYEAWPASPRGLERYRLSAAERSSLGHGQ